MINIFTSKHIIGDITQSSYLIFVSWTHLMKGSHFYKLNSAD